ncbi:TerB N-terminal domain-containing protein [Phaeospirillum tilakii]|uniref:TerB N-terminal domain-containing protein n=1 Tax=Phaeospirillum tilakii TaxID=741673 RepID=A0ABW5CDC7_9PROT
MRWIPAGQSYDVAGFTIPDGLLYVGKPVGSTWNAPKCVIDPALPVARTNPDLSGQFMSYWPSYSTISPESRLAYLLWLAGGRKDPNANIGYVFLYFYGLERRLLYDRTSSEVELVVAEVSRLQQIYSGNNSFRRYSADFLEAVDLLQNPKIDDKPQISAEPVFGLSPRLLIGLGARVNDGTPLDADWLLAWLLAHPETRLRTPARRAFEEFRRLFTVRFAAAYPSGLKVKPPKGRIGKIPYRASSGDFTAELGGAFEAWPNVSTLTGPINKAMAIAESCMSDLEAFSRLLGKEADSRQSLRARLLLPVELLADAKGEVAAVRDWLGSLQMPVPVTELLSRLGLALAEGKLGKATARQMAESLERLGYGVEPDVRFGGRTAKPGEPVVVFPLPGGRSPQAMPGEAYSVAALVLSLSALVIHADKVVTAEEERYLLAQAESTTHLAPIERARLEALARWLLAVPPSMAQLKPRLVRASEQQRLDLARFAIAVAGADGHVAVEEVKLLERIYTVLELEPSRLFSDLHALEVQADEPVVVRSAGAVPIGRTIPRPTETDVDATQPVVLDMARIERIRSDTAKVSSLLSDIFVEEVGSIVLAASDKDAADDASVFDGLDRRHEALLRELISRSSWPRSEFEGLCRQMELMPDGALENLNEWSFTRFDEAFIEDDDPITINLSLLETASAAQP